MISSEMLTGDEFRRTIDRLVRIALSDARKPAKFALRALAYCKDGKLHCGKVVNVSVDPVCHINAVSHKLCRRLHLH